MTPIVDLISTVIDRMKPAADWGGAGFSVSGTTLTISGATKVNRDKVYVGQKIVAGIRGGITSGVTDYFYGTIATIGDPYTTITLTATPRAGLSLVQTVAVIINYHYGHPLEIVNTFREIVKNPTYKYTQFPAICLFMDFQEDRNQEGYHAIADLNFVIMTDTKPEYKASDRYTNTFDTVLYGLYDLFIEHMRDSNDFECEEDGTGLPVHTKTDRLYWGKQGLYGNEGNMFQDFIDAIEITDFRIKVFQTC